ncbi:hypothetical protein OG292_03050 [Streptomyces sp. NBC_01511]|uniref:hypothetical protein n=1 Tax=Streptomyces sp. NBC_01511 TaxID=2903889 RepID=UPI00386C4026
MTARRSTINGERLEAVAGGIYAVPPEQLRDAAALVHRNARDTGDAEHILAVLGIPAVTPAGGES